MKVRVLEHQDVSPREGKQAKTTLPIPVRGQMLNCRHVVSLEDFSVTGRGSNHFLLDTKESLFINWDNPSLNLNKYS